MINKIVFTSPEAMVEFSREKLKALALFRNRFNMCKYSFKGQGIFSLQVNKPLGLQITLGESRFVMKFGRYVTVDGGSLCHVSVDPSIY